MGYWDIVSKYNINYNSTRNIVYLMKHMEGSDFKHLQMYCDLNNPLMLA